MKNFIPRATGGPWSGRDADAPVRFGFLLVPDFTLIGLGAAVDPLRLVNQVVGCTLYECITLTMDGEPVRSSAGVSVQPDGAVSNWMKALDALFVVGPNPLPTTDIQPVLKCLRTLAAAGVALGGIDTGSYYLAWAGLLNGYRSTIHWEDMDALLERFPQLVVSNKIYEVDRDRCSCSGGAAPLQMMSELIGRGRGGRKAMHAVAELLQFECYGEEERQKTSLQGISSAAHPKLIEAIKLMECNIEEPLRMEELAAHLAFSGRQLERLFKENVDCTPCQYYLQLRLERARQLLVRSNRSISDIAMACGFVSLAHFSHRYNAGFGISPSGERRRVTSDGGRPGKLAEAAGQMS